MAALVGFGAAAINPYLVFESIEDMLDRGVFDGSGNGIDRNTALSNYIKAAGKGVLKVMSKMGISTLASYTGAQLFQAVGISEDVLDEYFTGRRHRSDVPWTGHYPVASGAKYSATSWPISAMAPPPAMQRWPNYQVPPPPCGRSAPHAPAPDTHRRAVSPGDQIRRNHWRLSWRSRRQTRSAPSRTG